MFKDVFISFLSLPLITLRSSIPEQLIYQCTIYHSVDPYLSCSIQKVLLILQIVNFFKGMASLLEEVVELPDLEPLGKST